MSGRGDLWYLHCGKGIVAAVDKLQRVETLFASQKVFEKTRAQELVRQVERHTSHHLRHHQRTHKF